MTAIERLESLNPEQLEVFKFISQYSLNILTVSFHNSGLNEDKIEQLSHEISTALGILVCDMLFIKADDIDLCISEWFEIALRNSREIIQKYLIQ